MNSARIERSMLFVPASRWDMIGKAAGSANKFVSRRPDCILPP